MRVQQVHQPAEGEAELRAGVDEQPAAAGVAVVRVVDQFGDVGDLRTGEPGGLQQRPPARGQFHAAPVAAAAHRAAGVQRDVSQFAGGTGGAAVQPAVEHDTGADAGGYLDVHQVRAGPSGAPDVFAERAEVRVVLQPDR